MHFSEHNKLLRLFVVPGIPWNVDVALLAAVYFAIGFYHKDQIRRFLSNKCWRYDVLAFAIVIVFAVFCMWNYKDGQAIYYFDMKPVKYPSYVLAIIIPCGVGFVLARLMYWLSQPQCLKKIRLLISYIGQMTLPIMMMHVPLNTWKSVIGYDRCVYVFIGIVIPVIFVVALSRYAACRRWLGLPKLMASSNWI